MYACDMNVCILYGHHQILIMEQVMDEMRDYTSIRVEKEIRDELDALGKRRESYNEIIKRLLLFYRGHHGKK